MPTAAPAPVVRPIDGESPLVEAVRLRREQARGLTRLGIATVRDLLYHLPRRYDDSREIVPLSHLVPGETQTARATVRTLAQRRSPVKQVLVLEAGLEDDSGGHASAIWFNQGYLAPRLQPGTELLVCGPVAASRRGITFRNPSFERVSGEGGEQRHVGRLVPVYPVTAGISSGHLRSWIQPLLAVADRIPDVVPPQLRAEYGLLPINEALRAVHFPDTLVEAERARERLAFEELFLLQLAAQRARRRRLSDRGVVVPYDVELARAFVGTLPFRLTQGQRVAAHQILTDMASPGPMNRLLQGDVGSGKTVVAAMAALMTTAAGHQAVVMAPTEILARQHHATIEELLARQGLAPRLLVGSTSARARREVLSGLASGHDTLVVGTHALLEDDVNLPMLGLVVVDEQHRFGVAQRQRLRLKSGAMPNFLAMTATPIPRSLALTLYGDVNVSELREMPPGRIPVDTRVIAPFQRDEAYGFVRAQVYGGRQAFVICPLVEESDRLGARSATAEYERLRRDVFPDLRIELLHGRMHPRDKEAAMERFASGEADILVATSVVEVGVDVPNATIMLVEGAERFGMAQLHQLRGRVGRRNLPSHCLMFEGGVDDEGSRRLRAVAATSDGFELAELDLRARGPGDIIGMRQHGLPEMRAGDLLDIDRMQRAQASAADWLDKDPDLVRHAPLREAMHTFAGIFDLD